MIRPFLLFVFFAILSVTAQRAPSPGIDVHVCNFFESTGYTFAVNLTNIVRGRSWITANLQRGTCVDFVGAGTPGETYAVQVGVTGPTVVTNFTNIDNPFTMGSNSGQEVVFLTSTDAVFNAITANKVASIPVNDNEVTVYAVNAAADFNNVEMVVTTNRVGSSGVVFNASGMGFPDSQGISFLPAAIGNTLEGTPTWSGDATYGPPITIIHLQGLTFGTADKVLNAGDSNYLFLYGVAGNNHDGAGYRMLDQTYAYIGSVPTDADSSSSSSGSFDSSSSSTGPAGNSSSSSGPNNNGATSAAGTSSLMLIGATLMALAATRL